MVHEKTVLSLSFDATKLKLRETALRAAGFEVINAFSPSQARYEIEMGRCGIFMTSTLVSDIVNTDLIKLFRKHCPTGLVILISGNTSALVAAHEPIADIRIAESEDPQGIASAIRVFSGDAAPAS